MTTPPAPALWEHLTRWQPATAATLAVHLRALPDDWPQRLFAVGRPDAALTLPPAAIGEQYPDRAPEIAPYDEIASLETCPACEEAEGLCRFHGGYSAGHHERTQAERDAVSARPDISLREFIAWQADVSEAEDRGQEPPALPAPPSVPADVDLRERLREVSDRLAAHATGFQDVLDESDRGPWGRTVGADIEELRAVLAALPAPTDRAAGLAQSVSGAIYALKSPAPAGSQHYRSGWDDAVEVATEVARDFPRRMADEAQQTEPTVADTPRPTDRELLAELGPLRVVITDTLAATPVHLGRRGGTEQLADELTLALALYVGRDVLPAGALGAPPYEPSVTRVIETLRRGVWARYSRDYDDPTEARADFDQLVTERAGQHACRLVRATTSYAVEAKHTPEQP